MSITELPPPSYMLEFLRQKLNRGVMVAWINADLLNRADCDVRKSVVLYDEHQVFVMALGTSVSPALFRERLALITDSLIRAGVRYYSVGAK